MLAATLKEVAAYIVPVTGALARKTVTVWA
jgi:hypothetical protein